jgi:cyanophycin synthetase
MKRHAASGQRTVRTDGGAILAVQGTTVLHRIELARVPLTGSGTIPFQIDNAMAAVAAGWALELDWALIAAGLATFDSDPATVPGRFNRFSFRGATVIADYGHNPDAILALSQAIEAMPARRRSIVISAAGDRRDHRDHAAGSGAGGCTARRGDVCQDACAGDRAGRDDELV